MIETEQDRLLSIIADMNAKIVEGPTPQRKGETPEQFAARTVEFKERSEAFLNAAINRLRAITNSHCDPSPSRLDS